MRSPRTRRSGEWRNYHESQMTRARIPGARVVLWMCGVALAAMLVGCAPAAGGGDVTARATATSSMPVGTPTTEERLVMVARTAFGGGMEKSETTYDAQRQTVKVTGTLGGEVPVTASEVAAAHERTKALCFQVQRALWASGITLHEVTVLVRGPTFDDYGNQYLESYGTAVLGAATAGRLTWATLSADSAWEHYDSVWLRANYEPNWYYGAPPASTPTPTGGSAG